MDIKNKFSKNSVTLTSISGLFTILGLLFFDENRVLKYVFIILAIAIAFYAVILSERAKKHKKEQEHLNPKPGENVKN